MKNKLISFQLIRKDQIQLLIKLLSTRAIIALLCVLATPRALLFIAQWFIHTNINNLKEVDTYASMSIIEAEVQNTPIIFPTLVFVNTDAKEELSIFSLRI